jgi:hypothetical protein
MKNDDKTEWSNYTRKARIDSVKNAANKKQQGWYENNVRMCLKEVLF